MIKFLRKVLESCEGKPVIVVDRKPWYRWELERFGIAYFHETFGNGTGYRGGSGSRRTE